MTTLVNEFGEPEKIQAPELDGVEIPNPEWAGGEGTEVISLAPPALEDMIYVIDGMTEALNDPVSLSVDTMTENIDALRSISGASKEALVAYIPVYIARVREMAEDLKLLRPKKARKASSRAKGRKVAPKYRNPDTGDTWSGRGPKPKWLEAKIEAGRTLEDLKV